MTAFWGKQMTETHPREPCLICCPEAEIDPRIRDTVLELRKEFPHNVGQTLEHMTLPVSEFWQTWAQCWNCHGRGWVPRG